MTGQTKPYDPVAQRMHFFSKGPDTIRGVGKPMQHEYAATGIVNLQLEGPVPVDLIPEGVGKTAYCIAIEYRTLFRRSSVNIFTKFLKKALF